MLETYLISWWRYPDLVGKLTQVIFHQNQPGNHWVFHLMISIHYRWFQPSIYLLFELRENKLNAIENHLLNRPVGCLQKIHLNLKYMIIKLLSRRTRQSCKPPDGRCSSFECLDWETVFFAVRTTGWSFLMISMKTKMYSLSWWITLNEIEKWVAWTIYDSWF